MVFYIRRNFTKSELDSTFNEVVNTYEKEIGPLKAEAFETYFDGILNELRGVTDQFDGDSDPTISSGAGPYCFNDLDSSMPGDSFIDENCLNLYCPSYLSSDDCASDKLKLSYMSGIFEEVLESEEKSGNFLVVLDTGTALTRQSLASLLNYQNLQSCSNTTSEDLKQCLANSANCDGTEKECLGYINCQNIYTSATFPDIPIVDLRCLPFYSTASRNDERFSFYAQNLYVSGTVSDSFYVCYNSTLGTSTPFVNCFSVNLPKLLQNADTYYLPDMILFMKQVTDTDTDTDGSEVYLNDSLPVPVLQSLPMDSIIKNTDKFDLKTCLDNTDSTSSLERTLKQIAESTQRATKQINTDDCSLIVMKWGITLDTTTNLANETDTSEFSFFFIKDMTRYKELQDEITYISKEIVFFKLYVEVFLNQILFIIISKFSKRLVAELTKPLQELGEVLKDYTEPSTKEAVMLGKINSIDIKFLELVDLRDEITSFGYLCIVNQMILTHDLNPRILEKCLNIFVEKQNFDGVYIIYSHLVNFYLQKKMFPEAIENIDALINHLNDRKEVMTEGVHYNNDELTVVNLKLFYNYYRLINMRKKFLMMQEINKRPYWQDVMDSFRKLFSLLNEIEIKETIVLKLMIKKANIHFYLDKINHAEEAIMEAMNRYQEYVKHGRTPIHWSPDQKILCYLQQKLFLSCAEIKLKKNLYKEAYDYYMKCLEFGPIYSPNLRSKCYDGLSRLLMAMDEDIFAEEIDYAYKLSQFYRQDQKDFLFLLDSTKELNQNLGSIHRLIKDIFEKKMKPRDSFGIYCFSSELRKIQESINKRSLKGSALGVFNQNYELLKEAANEMYRHPWYAISEALDIIISNNDETTSKYLVVFVFGDVVPLINRKEREIKSGNKKMTQIWHQSVQDWQKRQSVYEGLIEKIEDSFVNIAILGYHLDPPTRVMYQRVCEAAKNGLFVSIDNEHPMEDTQELLDYF